MYNPWIKIILSISLSSNQEFQELHKKFPLNKRTKMGKSSSLKDGEKDYKCSSSFKDF
jgi:hypothetical protein